MKVIAIVGSPRRERGLTDRVVRQALAGAETEGAEGEVIYLRDLHLEPCIHCEGSCFETGVCAQDSEMSALSQRIDAAAALVIGAPVYCWRTNGLTGNFADKFRLRSGPWTAGLANGRPALGIAVAGGTGTGVMPALRSLYELFCLWQYRGIDPLPVTRFNLRAALEQARSSGALLACQARAPRPFESLPELLLYHDALPYMGYGRVDEFLWLAEQIAAFLPPAPTIGHDMEELRAHLDVAQAERSAGRRQQAAAHAVAAYEIGRRAWQAAGAD